MIARQWNVRWLPVSARMRAGYVVGLSALLVSLLFGAGTAHADTATRTSAFEYDAASGLITKEVVEPDNSTLCLVTSYSYDSFGNKVAVTSRNCAGSGIEAAAPTGDAVIAARTSTNVYDTRGQFPVTSANALNQSETKTYDPRFGSVVSLTGPNGLTTQWQYDDFGRKTLETRADGTRTQWSYLYCQGINNGSAACPSIGGVAAAWLAQATPLASDGVTQTGPISKNYYDGLDRVIRVETQGYDGNGSSTPIYQDTQYDSLGRPYMTSRPYYAGQSAYWITLTYDSVGRVITQTEPDGSVASTAFNGLTTTVTNAKGQTRTTTKNSQGQTVSVLDTNSQALHYSYDAIGNLIQTQDALGNVVSLTYDLRGRKTGMNDPDMGSWTYAYNALGQLVRQTDAKGQVSTLTYDLLGRMVQRTEPDLISKWYYDTYKGGGTCAQGIGKLCQAEADNGYNRTLSYDSLGRPVLTVSTINANYTAGVTYDSQGRVATQTYPGGVAVKYVYTALGYLKEVRDNASNALYWQANSLDAEGHLLQQTYGNGVVTQQTYNAANGRITGILAGAGNIVQNFTYTYDVLGNIASRNDTNQNLAETFTYDSLNRLTTATVNSSGAGIVNTSYAFDVLGNISSRSDVGTYTYPASGPASALPHALKQITHADGSYRTYAYDANGNLTTEAEYDASNNAIANQGFIQVSTSFNMPQAIGANGYSSAFSYGPEHQRVTETSTSTSGTTVYLNPGNEGALFYEKSFNVDSSVEERNFITAGGSVVAIVKQITTGNSTVTSVRYLHRDNLGSTTAITDEGGNVIERLAYEPYGKRRFPNGTVDPNNTIAPINTERGFTNHEHLDELGLIHMNGRIYDPLAARFTSADPNIQSGDDLQSYNRYSYVENSPLNATDPSGYFSLGSLFNPNPFHLSGNNVRDILSPNRIILKNVSYGTGQLLVSIGSAFCGPFAYLCAAGGNYENASVHGASFAQAVRAGAIAGLSVYVNGEIGASSAGFANVAEHAVWGCVESRLGGGSCESGAAAGAVSAALVGGGERPAPTTFDSLVFDYATNVVAGGLASELTGGTFANGAVTASYAYIFNYCEHSSCINLFAVGGGNIAAGTTGGEMSSGGYVTLDGIRPTEAGALVNNSPDGFQSAAGAGGGGGLSVGLVWGKTGSSDLAGPFQNGHLAIGIFSFDIYTNESGNIVGFGVGVGPGLGAGITKTNTTLYPGYRR
jgi:RHS repeat-associated protein